MQLECMETAEKITLITLAGRLDIEGTHDIDDRLSFITTVSAKKILIDLSAVSFLASIGIRLLLTSARAQSQSGGKMVFAAPQEPVRKVLVAAGVDQLVALHDDVASGLSSLAG